MHRHNDDVYSAQIHYLESEYAEKSQQQQEMHKLLTNQATAEHKFLADQQAEQLALEHKFKVLHGSLSSDSLCLAGEGVEGKVEGGAEADRIHPQGPR